MQECLAVCGCAGLALAAHVAVTVAVNDCQVGSGGYLFSAPPDE